ERHQLVAAWNETTRPYAAEACVHELFEHHAARTPGAIAVMQDGRTVSYATVNARATEVARGLVAAGVAPEQRVAVCLDRSVELVVVVLAIWKAGGVYVPLDPAYPETRLRLMLEDSRPVALLTTPVVAARAGVASLAASLGVAVHDIGSLTADGAWGEHAWGGGPAPVTAPPRVTPENAAYVIYTSGSTGTPKGVVVPHAGVCNLSEAQRVGLAVTAASRVLQFASVSFDAHVWELVQALTHGAALVLPAPGAALTDELVRLVRTPGALTHVTLPPAVATLLDDAAVAGLETIVLAGEAVPAGLVPRWPSPRRVINAYGPTEATVCATYGECARAGTEAPSIGGPIANMRTYVLDEHGGPVPIGVTGELFVGGRGVARGYLNRPGLTAERFVPDAFGGAGHRLYRTGDLARWRADGTLEFIGRADHQIKLRCHRIELGEIEAVLTAHPRVSQAVVVVRDDLPGDRQLVAYCNAPDATSKTLQAYLSERLPEHMVPAAYVLLDTFPLTPSGKIDRRKLPAPGENAFSREGYEAPDGDVEIALAKLWAEQLGVERVGRWDDFFALGGHSLLAVQVVVRVQQVLGLELDIGDLFDAPVLADFAKRVVATTQSAMPGIEPIARDPKRGIPLQPPPLSFAQQRLWFLEQMGGLGPAYHTSWQVRLRGALDCVALRRALDQLVARHESLRTTFVVAGGEPVQRIAPAEESTFALVTDDLHGPDVGQRLRALTHEEGGRPFDLTRGPLIRGRLIRIHAGDGTTSTDSLTATEVTDHAFVIAMHHIISDGWSLGIFADELRKLYVAARDGTSNPLPPLSVQYADYAAWQRRVLGDAVLTEHAAYWRQTLTGIPERLELTTDRPRPDVQLNDGESISVRIDPASSRALRDLSAQHGTTMFMTVLAGWAIVLSRLSGQSDIVIGTPTANRSRLELEPLIGLFVNTLALRIDVGGEATVAELLRHVKERAQSAQQHQDLPFEQIVEELKPVRSLAHSPVFQVMFDLQAASLGRAMTFPGVDVKPLATSRRVNAMFELSLMLSDVDGQLTGNVEYATALWDRATIERHVGYLGSVLRAMAADDSVRVSELPLLSTAERSPVVEVWNA
ncbi:MAG: amino acid adenylation domain-containing protein, partial [Gemmatimonadaceae bacterium]